MKFNDKVWESVEELRSKLHLISVMLPGCKTAELYYDGDRDPSEINSELDRYLHCDTVMIEDGLEQIWGARPGNNLLTAVMRQFMLFRPIDVNDFKTGECGGIELNAGVDLFQRCLTREETLHLFSNTRYFIDANGNSLRFISDEQRSRMDPRRCSHCGRLMRDRCVNKDCIIYGHYDLFD